MMNEKECTLVEQNEKMLEALEMVRDADDDCILDGLPHMPLLARAKVDSAIACASGNNYDD